MSETIRNPRHLIGELMDRDFIVAGQGHERLIAFKRFRGVSSRVDAAGADPAAELDSHSKVVNEALGHLANGGGSVPPSPT